MRPAQLKLSLAAGAHPVVLIACLAIVGLLALAHVPGTAERVMTVLRGGDVDGEGSLQRHRAAEEGGSGGDVYVGGKRLGSAHWGGAKGDSPSALEAKVGELFKFRSADL